MASYVSEISFVKVEAVVGEVEAVVGEVEAVVGEVEAVVGEVDAVVGEVDAVVGVGGALVVVVVVFSARRQVSCAYSVFTNCGAAALHRGLP